MRLLHIFWDTPMNGRQDALSAVAKKQSGIKLTDLKQGDLLMFVNKKLDKIAILSTVPEGDSHGVLGYYKSPGGRKISERALQFIPQSYGANGRIDMDAATRKAILQQLDIKEEEIKTNARGERVVIRRKL